MRVKNMSKIKVNQISENEVEVVLNGDVPLAMIESLTKSLEDKGLVQDLVKGTISKRYFNKPITSTHEVADELIKSLEAISKGKLPYWANSQADVAAHKAKNKAYDLQAQVKAAGAATTPKPITPAPTTPARTLPGVPNTLFNPEMSGKVNYTKKSDDHKENDPKCVCPPCCDKRKVNLAKSIQDMKDNKWGKHNQFPTADQPNTNQNLPTGEQLMANQLANMMMGKNMMKAVTGAPLLGSVVPAQPTDEQLFGHLVPSEVQLKKAEDKYNNVNSWLLEAVKPISSRFASEEEEMEYWSKLSVSERAGSAD